MIDLWPMAEAARDGRACPLPPALPRGPGLVQLTFRARGRRKARLWAEGESYGAALWQGLRQGFADAPGATTIEVTLALPPQTLPVGALSRAMASDLRGRYGLQVQGPEGPRRIGPVEMVTGNFGPAAALRRLGPGPAQMFDTRQYLIRAGAGTVALSRAMPLVVQDQITKATAAEMAAGMARWLVAQVGADGRMIYKYWPATGCYSQANNTIRQFMATTALAEMAPQHPEAARALQRNIAFNFNAFYRQEGALGVIVEGEKVKLGAAACALMACLALPDPAPYLPQMESLARFLLSMQRPDGSFATFLRPQGRDDCQNFYPGEAVLALAQLQARLPALDLTPRLLAAFRHYRAHHRTAPNPAFVPWWTRALVLLHQITGRGELADFALQMNDWLITLQAGPDRPEAVQGDFFHPAHPEYGPPHASATGVYLEGLIEALSLARRLNHAQRAEAYRIAILRGLRALRQLQFKGPEDCYFLGHPERVLGGLRTSVYDSTLRIDNVQHGLMALTRVLARLGEADFRISA